MFYTQSTIMVISGPVSTWAAIFHLWGSNWRVPYYHCVQAVPMVRLWVLWIFNLCTDVDACNCTCGLYEHHKTLRESAWQLTLEKKLPCHTAELNLCPHCVWPDTWPMELCPFLFPSFLSVLLSVCLCFASLSLFSLGLCLLSFIQNCC